MTTGAGMCELSRNPAQARASFVRAHRAYAGQGDSAGRTRAATGIVDSVYIEWSDFSSLDPWIEELAAALQGASPFDSRAEDLRTLAAALVAMLYRQPGHPLLPVLARRVRAILESGLDESLRVAAGTFLLNFWNWVGKPDEARAVIALVASAADSPQVTPLRRAWWLLRCAYHDYVVAEHDAALKKLDEVAGLAQAHGIRVVDVIGGLYRTFVHLNQGELDRAAAVLREVAPPHRSGAPSGCGDRRLPLGLAAGAARRLVGRRPRRRHGGPVGGRIRRTQRRGIFPDAGRRRRCRAGPGTPKRRRCCRARRSSRRSSVIRSTASPATCPAPAWQCGAVTRPSAP